ncbi:MAG: GTP-binding protein [archaeon]|nr:GTP-binding protein [archaeon]
MLIESSGEKIKKNSETSGKISFVGCPAVGKSTLVKMLSEKLIKKEYIPTQGFDLGSVSFNGFKIRLWDFGGQKSYIKHYLSQYVHGSDIVFVVTDSTPKNVLSTKELVDHTRSLLPENACRIVALANKQDLKNHLTPNQVKNILQIPTIGICALDPNYRDTLIDGIEYCIGEIEKERI